MEHQWLTFAKKLHAISSTGLHFGESEFDRERYAEVAEIATRMLAMLGEVPLERIAGLVPDFASGYATPRVDVRGALIEDDRILLVQEKSDGKWTLPGGYADVGLSAAINTQKEVQEEASVTVEAHRLIGVFHKAAHAYDQDVRDFYKFYFLCRRRTTDTPAPGPETLDARFFAVDELPELSTGRVIEEHIRLAFEHAANPAAPTHFD